MFLFDKPKLCQGAYPVFYCRLQRLLPRNVLL